MRIPSPSDLGKMAAAQTEAMLALPGLLITLTNQLRLLTEGLIAVNKLVDHVEQVVTDLEPGLRKLGAVLENPVIETIPGTIRDVQDNLIPVMLKLKDATTKFSAMIEQTSRIPGASLLTGRRRIEPDELER